MTISGILLWLATMFLGILVLAPILWMFFLAIWSSIKSIPYSGVPESIDWDALEDPQVWDLLPSWQTQRAAAVAYAELAGVTLDEARQVIAYAVRHWSKISGKVNKKQPIPPQLSHAESTRILNLIADGHLQEAIQSYAAYADVDQFTAREAVEQMQRED